MKRGIQRSWLIGRGLPACALAICLLLVMSVTAWASSVDLHDDANVLSASQVRSAASALPYPVSIYTVPNFSGSQSQFVQRADSHITNSNQIVIAISTSLHYIQIAYGSRVPLGNGGATAARNAFISDYQSNQDYTSATVACLNSMQSTLGTTGNGAAPAGNSGSSALSTGAWCLVGLAVLAAIAFFVILRRRSRGGMFRRSPMYGNPAGDPYNQYNQPYPPGGYGPGGAPYPPNRGMSPWAAGGLGAALGGLFGYGLGREQGERRMDNPGGFGGNDPNGGVFGGGSGGDFGGGNDPNGGVFGGGSGGDFGGGNGGNVGGGSGGDFGGGGGGGNVGGGSGGSF